MRTPPPQEQTNPTPGKPTFHKSSPTVLTVFANASSSVWLAAAAVGIIALLGLFLAGLRNNSTAADLDWDASFTEMNDRAGVSTPSSMPPPSMPPREARRAHVPAEDTQTSIETSSSSRGEQVAPPQKKSIEKIPESHTHISGGSDDTTEHHKHAVTASADPSTDEKRPTSSEPHSGNDLIDAVTPGLVPGPPLNAGPVINGGNGAVWSWSTPEIAKFEVALWMERQDHKGEDAPPTLISGPTGRSGMLGVYDGTGGSGSGLVTTGDDGEARTGAWLASRAVRSAAEGWFNSEVTQQRGIDSFTENMRTALHERLAEEMHQVAGSSRLAGTLRRDLPTTMATVAYQIRQNGSIATAAMWVGDSRAYILTPSAGLQQTTLDDSHAPDALTSLVDDPPMTNVISAKGDFQVHLSLRSYDQPLILIAATDGCFGYVATPAHFEILLLRALAKADDPEMWMAKLLDSIAMTTNDDASLAAVAIGYPDFASLKEAFGTRQSELETLHWEPFANVDTTNHAQLTAFRTESWRRYKDKYEQLVPTEGPNS